MPTINDILSAKGSRVFTIGPQATVHEAAVVMNQHKIGCLVVVEGEVVAGIFTERDVLSRVVAERKDPAHVKVGQVMTKHVMCCRTETSIEEARGVFKNRRVRHLPVVDDNRKLLGLISIGDINAWSADAQEQTIYFLQEYIYGRT